METFVHYSTDLVLTANKKTIRIFGSRLRSELGSNVHA